MWRVGGYLVTTIDAPGRLLGLTSLEVVNASPLHPSFFLPRDKRRCHRGERGVSSGNLKLTSTPLVCRCKGEGWNLRLGEGPERRKVGRWDLGEDSSKRERGGH